MKLEIFLFEYKHFIRSKAKLYSFLFFTGLCLLSIFNGYQNLEKQKSIILEIKKNEQKEIDKMLTWYDEKISGPDDRSWVDISNPFWSIYLYTTFCNQRTFKIISSRNWSVINLDIIKKLIMELGLRS